MDFLHYEFLTLGTFVLTGWKIIVLTGGTCFGLRWVVQVWHRKRTGSAVVPVRPMTFQPVSTKVPRVRNS